jgi:hypothetical protein
VAELAGDVRRGGPQGLELLGSRGHENAHRRSFYALLTRF